MTTTPSANNTTHVSNRVSAKPARQEQLRKLLVRKSGASIAQIQKSFGRQPHTVRAAISAQPKAGYEIIRTDPDKGSVYRLFKECSDR